MAAPLHDKTIRSFNGPRQSDFPFQDSTLKSDDEHGAAAALRWIAALLEDLDCPYVICGGLAAAGFGATRPIHDIDLFVPDHRFQDVVQAARDFISKPATHYRHEHWDLDYVQFIYQGTKIEVGNADGAKILNAQKHEWVALDIDFRDPDIVTVLGVSVPLMHRDALIAYKRLLDRVVDREDIQAISP